MDLKSFFSKNAAPIMIIGGIVGFVVTNILTAKAAEKYLKEKEKLPEDSTWQEDLMVAAKCYAPAVVSGVASAGLIFGGNRKYAKVQAGLVSAYTLLNTRYSKERDAVLKNIGLEDLTKIKEEINKPIVERMKKQAVSEGSILVVVKDYDPNVYIETTMVELTEARRTLQEQLAKKEKVSLSYFIEQIGGNPNMTSETVGWNMEYLYGNNEHDFIDSDILLIDEKDGSSYYSVEFPTRPIAGYDFGYPDYNY